MALVLTAPPAIEPVSIAEAKAHLRLDHSDEDLLVGSLVVAARTHLERLLSRAFITQTWSLHLDRWPAGHAVALGIAPVQSIAAVKLADADGVETVLDASLYLLDGVSRPARLLRRSAAGWPVPRRQGHGIEVSFVAGHGDAATDVPADLRHALRLLVAHWYENRQAVEIGSAAVELPHGVSEIVAGWRWRGL